ncbi:hypothetical protein [Chryseobacterium sp. JV274]|nr:hypothetical protein [Chryseobacterium sp. JV274]
MSKLFYLLLWFNQKTMNSGNKEMNGGFLRMNERDHFYTVALHSIH